MGKHKWRLVLPLLFVPFLFAEPQETLLIGPGDMLHVQVFDTPELEQHARVTDAGEIPLALVGKVKVSEMTPADAAQAVEKALVERHLLQHPHVQVTVEEYATQKVTVLGEVKSPGPYATNTPRSVLDVLTLAGGLTDLADRKIVIQRHGSQEKVPYFVSNQAGVALDTAVKVNPGDTLIVPKAGIVYVLGDVARPGGYTMTNNEGQISVVELVAHAGGTNHSAVPSHAKLIRKTDQGFIEMPLPLSDMQKGKRADEFLQANDIVYVPFSYVRNFGMQASGIAASVGSAAVYRF